ncbi:MAG: response regulator [Gammaproteobacteria bacterium]|nr:response regulator [Gammaproteobacteria bacterium]
MFKNWSIQNKVMLISGVAIFGFIIYLASNYFVSTSTDAHLTRFKDKNFPVLEIVNETSIAITSLKLSLGAAVDTGEEEELIIANDIYEKSIKNLNEIRKISPDLADQVQAVTKDLQEYYKASHAVAKGLLDNSIESNELYILVPKINISFSSLTQKLKQLRQNVTLNFSTSLNDVTASNNQAWRTGALLSLGIVIVLLIISVYITNMITRGLNHAVTIADKIADGDWSTEITISSEDETGHLLSAISTMRDKLRDRTQEDHDKERLQSQVADLNECMRGDQSIEELCRHIINYVTPGTGCQVGAFYAMDDKHQQLSLTSSYALTHRKGIKNTYQLGESLVGQTAIEKKQICVSELPEDYMAVSTGLGQTSPRNILLTPVIHDELVVGIIELGSIAPINEQSMLFLSRISDSIGIAINSARSRVQLAHMLGQTQKQAASMEKQQTELQRVNDDLEEQANALKQSDLRMQHQQEELRASNEELEEQTQALKASELNMQAQQEELRVTNEELAEQAKILETQKEDMLIQNQELGKAQEILQEKSEALELSSKYKSEFLSTMSHELRTPLNSILILSRNLSENKPGNLADKQIEHCDVIHSAGSDLLALINDILDLSKVEEGKLQIVLEDLPLQIIQRNIQLNFEHVAKEKNLDFSVTLAPDIPEALLTDRQRVEQILKNLLSNAFKFTPSGGVYLDIARPTEDMLPAGWAFSPNNTLAFTVRDTGLGIPKNKQNLIFEAFQQADGTTSRNFGGTGLGLTISRQLAKLLQGELKITSSTEGEGSSFTLLLPDKAVIEGAETSKAQAHSSVDGGATDAANEPVENASSILKPKQVHQAAAFPATSSGQSNTVLIVEDDPAFAELLADRAMEHGIDTHVCHHGESALAYVETNTPCAIILDIGLPDMSGLKVMEKLKAKGATKSIPVHFISGKDDAEAALAMGAYEYLKKPISNNDLSDSFQRIEDALKKPINRLLVIEDNEISKEEIIATFSAQQIEVVSVDSGAEAISHIKESHFDCMILDLDLPDTNGLDLLEKINADPAIEAIPVVVYTAKDLMREEEAQLRKYADRIILKTDQSSERLLNEASLFFNWVGEQGDDIDTQRLLEPIDHREDIFQGKKLLVVDDDMRNIYSVSAILEDKGFDIEIATNGEEAIEALNESPDKDLVLMDIMMPVMDGYEAMGLIRKDPRFSALPIIALTAKAMKSDRQKCISAGANDYVTKPLDADKLLSLIRVWLQQS